VDSLDDATKIDFGMKLKSTGLNRLVKFLRTVSEQTTSKKISAAIERLFKNRFNKP